MESVKSNKSKLVSGSLISFGAIIIIGVLNYLIRRTLALDLDPETFGFFYSSLSFAMIFLTVLDLGLTHSATILITRNKVLGKATSVSVIYSQVFWIKLILGFIIIIPLIYFAEPITTSYFKYKTGLSPFVYLLFIIPLMAIETAPLAVLDAYKDFKAKGIIQILKVVLIFLAVIFYTPEFGVFAAAIAYPLGSLISMIIGALFIHCKYKINVVLNLKSNIKDIASLWRLSRWVAVSTAGLSVIYFTDTQMLTMLDSLTNVGVYNIAISIIQIIQGLMVLPIVFTPIATELWHEGKIEEIKSIVLIFMSIMHILLWGTLLAFMVFSNDVITILFHEKYIDASMSLIILSGGMFFYLMAQFNMAVLNIAGKFKSVAQITLVMVGLNILLNYLLIPEMGITGASIATAVTYVSMSLLILFQMAKLKLFELKEMLSLNFLLPNILGLAALIVLYFFGVGHKGYQVICICGYIVFSIPFLYKSIQRFKKI